MNMDEFSLNPQEAGWENMDALMCLTKHLNEQAMQDSNDPLIGITAAILALIEKTRTEIEDQLEPLKDLRIVRYARSPKNQEAGVAGEFIRLETRPGASFSITPEKETVDE